MAEVWGPEGVVQVGELEGRAGGGAPPEWPSSRDRDAGSRCSEGTMMSAGFKRGWDSGNRSGGKRAGGGVPSTSLGVPSGSGGAWEMKGRDGGGSPPGL